MTKKNTYIAIIIFQFGETEIEFEEAFITVHGKTRDEAYAKVEKFINHETVKPGRFKNYKFVKIHFFDDVLFDKTKNEWFMYSRYFKDLNAYETVTNQQREEN
jgi:hypothetical protein